MRKYLPVYLDVTDYNILLIGGGEVASQKVKSLIQFTHNLTVLAPTINEFIKDQGVNLITEAYTKEQLSGFHLIYACTNNRILNQEIKQDAEQLHLLVNVVDDPELCDFITPAVYTDENFCIAVSTFGKAPGTAAKIRNRIKTLLPVEELTEMVAAGEKERNKKK
ncbi:MAG: bifunctional precorrin-2 dehydrogenase/sirohydrochlorin ferrochelatase [Fibrobacteria bacterium]|nr:bifunctional precorrin-2 dehydrogenase/sirohydrochlorin ferrochelatase [Fibrobacteria bacterium]